MVIYYYAVEGGDIHVRKSGLSRIIPVDTAAISRHLDKLKAEVVPKN